jgi:hypothetical protein
MIDAEQNADGGRALGRFYLHSRVIATDLLLMWLKSASSARQRTAR